MKRTATKKRTRTNEDVSSTKVSKMEEDPEQKAKHENEKSKKSNIKPLKTVQKVKIIHNK
jgi:hypothetical protein